MHIVEYILLSAYYGGSKILYPQSLAKMILIHVNYEHLLADIHFNCILI